MKDRFLRACRLEAVDRTPVWFMRQAGRSSPAYRALRTRHGMLGLARDPALAARVTLQPVAELGVDAAILFSDLLLPLEPMGVALTIVEGRGPALSPPVRTPEDVGRLKPLDPSRDLGFVLDTLRRVRSKSGIPLLGFAGAPFTLASYLIEGGGTKDFQATKRFMYEYPHAWRMLMGHLQESITSFLLAQVDAGAQALQIFDSWAGALSPADYTTRVQPWSRKLFDSLREADVPTIHFGTGTAGFLEPFRSAGGSVIGVDWRIPLDRAWDRIGHDRGIQGNLDPAALLGPSEEWRMQAGEILRRAEGRQGHIFNLGHGVLPATSPESLRALVRFVHGHQES